MAAQTALALSIKELNISPFLQKQITQLISRLMAVSSNNLKINEEVMFWFSLFHLNILLASPSAFCILQGVCTFLIIKTNLEKHKLLFKLIKNVLEKGIQFRFNV